MCCEHKDSNQIQNDHGVPHIFSLIKDSNDAIIITKQIGKHHEQHIIYYSLRRNKKF